MCRAVFAGVALALWLSGCGGSAGVRCEDQERYVGSGQIAPLQIPDDLDPPDETEALRVPTTSEPNGEAGQNEDAPEDAREGACLESPPEYFEQGLPG